MQQKTPPNSFWEATGELPCALTNDLMFVYVFQKNKRVLKALLCSLLHLEPEKILSLEIKNPITLGEHITDKRFIMDILLLLNNSQLINIEMQVENEGNWPERSLGYLCRSFDNLNRGQDYIEVKPALHISIVDFNVNGLPREFFSRYLLMNTKNHAIFTGKLELDMLNLRQAKLATDEDKHYQLDQWAKLFKATTWREIHMLAQENETFASAADTMFDISKDKELWALFDREKDARIRRRAHEKYHAKLKAENAVQKRTLAKQEAEILYLRQQLADATSPHKTQAETLYNAPVRSPR